MSSQETDLYKAGAAVPQKADAGADTAVAKRLREGISQAAV